LRIVVRSRPRYPRGHLDAQTVKRYDVLEGYREVIDIRNIYKDICEFDRGDGW